MLQKIKFVKLLSELKTINQHDLKNDANKKLHVKTNEQSINRWDCAEVVQGKTDFQSSVDLFFIDENMLMFVFTVVKGIFATGLVLGLKTHFRLIAIS